MIEAENKIQAPKTGPEFLAASHFSISNDSRWGPRHDPEAHKSIFKIDYPPLPLTKQGRIPSPPPAGIMHKDDRYADTTSMTKSHFVKKPFSRRMQEEYASYALRKTNFKGDSDSKLQSFQTTHKEYFPVRPLQEAKSHPTSTKAEWMKSCIPQGDKEKEVWPQSDYRSRYLGEQTEGPVFAKGDLSGRLTITGDPRTQNGQFVTTTKTEFVNRYLPKQSIDPSLLAGGSNIPQGDLEKCNDKISTQQHSFRPKTISGISPFNREEAVKRLRQTTFKLGDQRSPGHLQTTAADSYPYPTMDNLTKAANVNVGQSSFPEGDMHPERSHERITKTTNDVFFGNPALGHRNTLVKGSHLRTKSNVHLGHSASSKYYDTSMKTDYTALPNIHKTPQIGNSNNSSLPLDYYRGFVGVPTTWNDFPSHAGIPKLLPNPLSLQNLKMSHIHPQIPGEREFSTTHQRCYTPKKSSRIDVKLGSLQRSSVPLGNLNMYR